MKNTSLATGIAVVIALAAGLFIFNNDLPMPAGTPSEFDRNNVKVVIEENTITLVNGVAQSQIDPNSASKVTTRYFGNEAYGDLNGDGREDVAFLVTQENGGSGLFYYVVVALQTSEGYKTTNAFYIGDRIAPQNTEIHTGELHINFAERRPGEPMTAEPSQGAVLVLKVTPEGVLEGLMK